QRESALGRASRSAVDHGHESDRFVWSAALDHFVAYQHLDQAGLDDIHAGARLTLIEDNASSAERHSCADPPREHSHVDFIAIHVRLAFQAARRLITSLFQKTP